MDSFKNKIVESISESIETKKRLLDECTPEILHIGSILGDSVNDGNKIMFCGNGGSAADCQHLAAELVVRLRPNVNRNALPGMALTVDPSVITAGGNDYGYDSIFERSVEAFGKDGDVLIGISTSGNSENVLRAMKKAKSKGVITVGLLGKDGGKIAPACDMKIIVPSDNTARIQESHIMIGHIWCEIIEECVFPELFE
ncbi:D-sedoheptulose 7-phosphate isomerase [Candidatus Kapabacteria bacterium]|nr:D-sedoheptulose 7-phosphate isomerase [Candidatus Kapabacteria bacterium]